MAVSQSQGFGFSKLLKYLRLDRLKQERYYARDSTEIMLHTKQRQLEDLSMRQQ